MRQVVATIRERRLFQDTNNQRRREQMVDPTIAHHVINATIQTVAPIVKNVVPTLQPDSAPLWLDVFIWMALFWQYILIGFVPAFYIAVAKLFGMPLLQRWRQEVVIMLYPNKVVFCKIKEQMEPYFAHKNGIYWFDTPIQPLVYEEDDPAIQSKLVKLGEKYEVLRLKQEDLASPDNKMVNKEQLMKKYEKLMNGLLKQQMRLRKRVLTVNPGNTLHIPLGTATLLVLFFISENLGHILTYAVLPTIDAILIYKWSKQYNTSLSLNS